MKVLAEFTARWTVCWMTTYTFEPPFLETVLARRLGEPPLNTVVLADQDRLSRTWAGIGPGERWSIRGAGRTYLIRGVALPAGVFHPKTILLANDREGVLLVGSGNVGFGGFDNGKEIYCRFHSEQDGPAFASWREWMNELVAFVDEPLLRLRWGALLGQLRWLPSDTTGSPFITNWRSPILGQFLRMAGRAGATVPIDELHFEAPFFDSELTALSALIEGSQPRKIVGYFGLPTSVDGAKLVGLLDSGGRPYQVFAVEPEAFVHAKLFGLLDGDNATVLSGSANASSPALLKTALTGNAEAGVVWQMASADARALLFPPDSTMTPLGIESMHQFEFKRSSEVALPRTRLIAATLGYDGRITVAARPDPGSAFLTDGSIRVGIRGGTSVETLGDQIPDLVWLEDTSGERLSNSVPLDIRADLEATLRSRDPGPDRPREMEAMDMNHPLGRLMAGLNSLGLFDIEDTPAGRHAQAGEVDEGEVDDTFWERLLRDGLDADPRSAGYHRFGSRVFADDELLWLLEEMLHRAPSPTVLRLIDGTQVERPPSDGPGEPKVGLRAYNVLVRWSLALTDNRVSRRYGETAQVRHYSALLSAIAEIWPQGWIKRDRLVKLLGVLFGAFIRRERATGYLGGMTEDERAPALAALAETPAPEVAAALAYAALRDAGTDAFFEWQPFLIPGVAWGVFRPSAAAASLASSLVGSAVTEDALSARLDFVASYTDDDHWCERISALLGTGHVKIDRVAHPLYGVEVSAQGLGNVLTDPRAVALARAALSYRRGAGVRLRADGAIVAIALGRPIFAAVSGREFSSIEPVNADKLEALVAEGSAFGSLLVEEAAAS
jgi:hypothetical protein